MARVLVLGLGVSGTAAAELLLSEGHTLVGMDCNPDIARLPRQFPSYPADTPIDIETFDQLVVSPGVSPKHPIYQQARKAGVDILGEMELGLQRLSQPSLVVTGTNGKTTVTRMVEHLLRFSGIPSRALGNIGDPLTRYCLKPNPHEVLVVEASSYQLETVRTPVFDAGIILNITPDHLDRYDSFTDYVQAKCFVTKCLKPSAPLYLFSAIEALCSPFLDRPYEVFDVPATGHDMRNVHAALSMTRCWNVDPFVLSTFKKSPHRIEFVEEINGVSYYDDSKGTNVDAVICAVASMPSKVVLIVGGVDKGGSYAPWKEAFSGKVKTIIALGRAADKIQSDLEGLFSFIKVESMEEAVHVAKQKASAGDSVLLSPGCASFDMFKDYAHRGTEFQMQVRRGK